MKFNHLALSSAIIGALILTGCGGSSSPAGTDPATTTTTAFSINVQVPDGLGTTQIASAPASFFDDFFISTAAAETVSDQLGAGNFKVAIVNAAGVVTQIVIPESISQEADGSWILVLAGGTRVDCVIIADVSKTPDVTVGQTLPSDAIYAPTASEKFDIDIRSTTAFQEFIEEVEDSLDLNTDSGFTEEQIAALVETAQELPLPAYTPGQTLEQYLEAVIPELEALVEIEVVKLNNTDLSFSFAAYIEGGSVINWIWGEAEEYDRGQLSYDPVSGNTTDNEETYNSISKMWEPLTVTAEAEALILTPTGWVANSDLIKFETFNADGTVIASDTAVPEEKETLSAVKIDVSGQKINLFASDFKPALANSAVFSAGAEAYLISTIATNDTYYIWGYDDGSDFITFPMINSLLSPITTLDEMFSATAANGSDPAQMNLIISLGYGVELVGATSDTSGTANIYAIDYGSTPAVATIVESTTWERRTVSGKDLVIMDTSATTIEAFKEASFYMLTKYNGAVVLGSFNPAGLDTSDPDDYVFNDIAAQDINDNFNPDRLTCNFSSTWNDVAGEPDPFNSYDDFLEVLVDCGGARPLAAADLEGSSLSESWDEGGVAVVETLTFNSSGVLGFSETRDGIETESETGIWSVANNLLTLTNQTGDLLDIIAIVGTDHQLAYTEESGWTSTPNISVSNPAVAEGEIWHGYFGAPAAPAASTVTCNSESGYDDDNDIPAAPFFSFDDFEASVADCGGLVAKTEVDMVGTWIETDSTVIFNNNNTGTWQEGVEPAEAFVWSISNGYVLLADSATPTVFFEYWAFTTIGQMKAYYEGSEFADVVVDGTKDGELWTPGFLKN